MNPKTKAYILSALRGKRGDDLERANAAFGRMTFEELEKEYGQSGRTCRQIWDGFKEERAENDAAFAAVNAL